MNLQFVSPESSKIDIEKKSFFNLILNLFEYCIFSHSEIS